MSKRKNRLLAEREAEYRLSRDPYYIAGALASGVPADINPALAPVGTLPKGRDAKQGAVRSKGGAVAGEAGQAPKGQPK